MSIIFFIIVKVAGVLDISWWWIVVLILAEAMVYDGRAKSKRKGTTNMTIDLTHEEICDAIEQYVQRKFPNVKVSEDLEFYDSDGDELDDVFSCAVAVEDKASAMVDAQPHVAGT